MDPESAVVSRLRSLYLKLLGIPSSEKLVTVLCDEFRRLYGQKHRHYHTFSHIADCLCEFTWCSHQCTDPLAVEMALLYHDIVYEPISHDNEQLSANKAKFDCARLGVDAAFTQAVTGLILATCHKEILSGNSALVADIDLSILGQPWERFLEYDRLIREEYISVPDKDYVAGRYVVLDGFLRRTRIFQTDLFRDRYEKSARANIARALMRLTTHA